MSVQGLVVKPVAKPVIAPRGNNPRFGYSAGNLTNLGATVNGDTAHFKLWAPAATGVEVNLISPRGAGKSPEQRVLQTYEMDAAGVGTFEEHVPVANQNPLYMYRLKYADGSKSQLLPDPRSRFQPEDVHGPSQILGGKPYAWQSEWKPVPDKRRLNIQKMHVGTFTKEGTFNSALAKLDELRKNGKGFNAVEVMPVKEFPGRWNWGYDMVDYFAVENTYGKPDDFKKFVDECHKRGIAVLLDVVYNHVGPEGNYLPMFDRGFLKPGATQWGDGFNWENPAVVKFIQDNLSMWVDEFNVDGFRFDMTNHIPDPALRGVTAYMSQRHPNTFLFAEDGRSDNHVTKPRDADNGLGFWAKWNFKFHHFVKSTALGRSHEHAPSDLGSMARLLEDGFEPNPEKANNGRMERLGDAINFFETHDEIGNHDGIRTNVKLQKEDPENGHAKFKVFSTLKYLVPGIPLSLMGEQYGETSPYHFFADYSDKQIRKNMVRNREGWKLSQKTFNQCKLGWQQDAGIAALNRDMAALRENTPALWQGDREQMQVHRQYLGSNVLALHRWGKENPEDQVFVIANLSGYNYVNGFNVTLPGSGWEEVLNSDDVRYGGQGMRNPGVHHWYAGLKLAPYSVAVFRKTAT